MKVKELIEELKKYSDNSDVFYFDSEWGETEIWYIEQREEKKEIEWETRYKYRLVIS